MLLYKETKAESWVCVLFFNAVVELSPCHTRQLTGKDVVLEGDMLSLCYSFLAVSFFFFFHIDVLLQP